MDTVASLLPPSTSRISCGAGSSIASVSTSAGSAFSSSSVGTNSSAASIAPKTAGGSAVVEPGGGLLLEAGREPCRQVIELDMQRLAEARRDYRYLDERRMPLPGQRVEHDSGLRELLIP